MGMPLDPNMSSIGPIQGPGYMPPPPTQEETDVHDPTKSTLQQSLAEALMVQFLVGWPILPEPGDSESGYQAETVAGIYATTTAEIINDMWDSYIDHLQEQKQRIADYLQSPAYRQFIEERTMEGQVHEDLTTGIDTESPVYSATEYNMYLNSRVQSAIDLWSNAIDGVTNYVRENRDINPAATLFLVASFAITATYIGDYAQIVDVASTDMVTVNPIQDSISQILPLVPQQLQEQYTLVINLFAIGLMNFANAEAILKAGQESHRPPTSWDAVVAFARNVLESVEGNTVNLLLMAMLVNHIENLGSTEEQRVKTLSRLEILAKAMMLSVAVAALLKGATPDLRLTGLIFTKTMTEPLEAKSQEDAQLLNELAPLVAQFHVLREEGGMSEEFWDNVMAAMGDFFESNPNIEDLVNPTVIYGKLAQGLFNSELEG